MSGLLALLDDVAAIAKVAAASVDDIAGAAAKAGAKAAGVVIDDAAVTPKYVHGFAPARELPIIWRIARGSLFNKLVILLPAALLLANFLPQAITPLLMLGGTYLCFEGAEKILHSLHPPKHEATPEAGDVHLEESRVRGAIKTDFILSAEIMAISLAALPDGPVWQTALALGLVAVAITAAVYGAVGLIVKMDDVGLHLARNARLGLTRRFGQGLVRFMPRLMALLSVVGTAAMLWVGGSIIVHGLEELGWPLIGHGIEALATMAATTLGTMQGAVHWIVTAAFDGILGLGLGLLVVVLMSKLLAPALRALRH